MNKVFFHIALIFGCFVSGSMHGQTQPTKIFNVLMNPEGWPVPTYGKVYLGSPPYPINLAQYHVDIVPLQLQGQFEMPYIYMSGETLVVSKTMVTAKTIERLSFGGRTFGYHALVFSVDTTAAFPVWWIDSDGSGRCGNLIRSNSFPGVPSWLTVKKAKG